MCTGTAGVQGQGQMEPGLQRACLQQYADDDCYQPLHDEDPLPAADVGKAVHKQEPGSDRTAQDLRHVGIQLGWACCSTDRRPRGPQNITDADARLTQDSARQDKRVGVRHFRLSEEEGVVHPDACAERTYCYACELPWSRAPQPPGAEAGCGLAVQWQCRLQQSRRPPRRTPGKQQASAAPSASRTA